jgi:hypothetical protein
MTRYKTWILTDAHGDVWLVLTGIALAMALVLGLLLRPLNKAMPV